MINVNGHEALVNELLENVIHHGLEGGWAVGETEVHDQGFKESAVDLAGSFPLVTLFNTYIVISPAYVQLCEVLALASEILLTMSGTRGSG